MSSPRIDFSGSRYPASRHEMKTRGREIATGCNAPAAAPTAFLPSAFSSDSQHIYFDNCTPGELYTAQFRALGGSEGTNDWSDPTTHRAK